MHGLPPWCPALSTLLVVGCFFSKIKVQEESSTNKFKDLFRVIPNLNDPHQDYLLTFYLAKLLTFSLANLLTFYLTFLLMNDAPESKENGLQTPS